MTQPARFGEFELRTASRELLRRGEVITVQPKAFDLLAFLLTNRDRAVDKQELQDVLWPDVIVTETALTRCVMKARRAVDDDAERQAVIKTVHGHGYRFVATVDDVPATDTQTASDAPIAAGTDDAAQAGEHASKAPPWFRRRLGWSALATLVALAFILWLLRPVPIDANSVRVAVLPVVNATGQDDLAWTELGLMSLMTRMMREDGGLAMAGERRILALLDDTSGPLGESEMTQVAESLDASYLVTARLEASGGLLRLNYALIDRELGASRRSIVGEKATELAQLAGRDLTATLTGDSTTPGPSRVVSEDPFVNEAYARGLSLQLEGKAAEARALFKVASEQDPTLFWTRYEYALSTRILGELDLAAELLTELQDEVRMQPDKQPLMAALNGLGLVRQLQGQYPAAEALYLEGIELAREADTVRMLRPLLVNLAILSRRRGDLDAARTYLNEARAVAHRMGVAPGSSLLNTLAQVEAIEGNLDAAQDNYERALAAARRENNKRFEASALTNLATIKRRLGQFDAALVLLEQSLSVRRAIGDVGGVARASLGLAATKQELGQLDDALGDAQVTLEYGRQSGDRVLEGDALNRIATLQILQRQPQAAADTLDQAMVIWDSVEEPRSRRAAQMKVVRVHLLHEAYGDALALVDSLIGTLADGDETGRIYLTWLRGDVLEAQGETDEALKHFARALEAANAIRSSDLATASSQKLAEAFIAAGSADEAEPHIAVVADARPDSWETLRLRGQLALARGQSNEARDLLRQAKSKAGGLWSDADEAQLDAAGS